MYRIDCNYSIYTMRYRRYCRVLEFKRALTSDSLTYTEGFVVFTGVQWSYGVEEVAVL